MENQRKTDSPETAGPWTHDLFPRRGAALCAAADGPLEASRGGAAKDLRLGHEARGTDGAADGVVGDALALLAIHPATLLGCC